MDTSSLSYFGLTVGELTFKQTQEEPLVDK